MFLKGVWRCLLQDVDVMGHATLLLSVKMLWISEYGQKRAWLWNKRAFYSSLAVGLSVVQRE